MIAAPIEFVEHRRESGIARVVIAVARKQSDAVGAEDVEQRDERRRAGTARVGFATLPAEASHEVLKPLSAARTTTSEEAIAPSLRQCLLHHLRSVRMPAFDGAADTAVHLEMQLTLQYRHQLR